MSPGPSALEELMLTSLPNLQDLSIGMLASIKTHCVACASLCNKVEETNYSKSKQETAH